MTPPVLQVRAWTHHLLQRIRHREMSGLVITTASHCAAGYAGCCVPCSLVSISIGAWSKLANAELGCRLVYHRPQISFDHGERIYQISSWRTQVLNLLCIHLLLPSQRRSIESLRGTFIGSILTLPPDSVGEASRTFAGMCPPRALTCFA